MCVCVFYQDNFNVSVAGLTVGDYRLDGKDALICCSVDGEGTPAHLSGQVTGTTCLAGVTFSKFLEVRQCYLCSQLTPFVPLSVRGFSPSSGSQRAASQATDGSTIEQQTIHELSQRRQTLLLELKNYEVRYAAGQAKKKRN